MKKCEIAPTGWYCTRPDRHLGPCAAYPKWWNFGGWLNYWFLP